MRSYGCSVPPESSQGQLLAEPDMSCGLRGSTEGSSEREDQCTDGPHGVPAPAVILVAMARMEIAGTEYPQRIVDISRSPSSPEAIYSALHNLLVISRNFLVSETDTLCGSTACGTVQQRTPAGTPRVSAVHNPTYLVHATQKTLYLQSVNAGLVASSPCYHLKGRDPICTPHPSA